MKSLIALVLIGLLCGAATKSAERPDPLFVPVGIFYMNGKFVKIVPVGTETFINIKECMETLQRAVGGVMQSGTIPNGGSMIGGCVPVPATNTPTAAT